MKKILVIRFSSIGDIILTTPIVRCIHQQLKDCEVHFLTKNNFKQLLINNPNISKIYGIDYNVEEVIPDLKLEKYDFIVDLHKNLRSKEVVRKLKIPSKSFNKLNLQKFLLTQFKIDRLPSAHIVDRYFQSVEGIGVDNDLEGLDYFISETTSVSGLPDTFHCFAIGGSFETKKLPSQLILEIIDKSPIPVVIIGGKEDEENGKTINQSNNCINLIGQLSIDESAYVMMKSQKVISHDTGMMHIASALQKEIISIWGNTVPDFGMTPYLAHPDSVIIENKNISCRPCSKLGYKKCPKGHFKCMTEINLQTIQNRL